MKPLSVEFQTKKTNYKNIEYRRFPDSAIREMGQWLQSKSCDEIYKTKCPNEMTNHG